MAERKVIDWEAVELDYRSGILTIRNIGVKHGVSHTLVNRKAKDGGWARDLKERIKLKAEALVSKAAVSGGVAVETLDAEVNANAMVIANVVLSHRTDVGKGRSLTRKLLQELEGQCDNPDLLKQLADILLAPEDGDSEAATKRKERMYEQFNRALSLGGRVDTMKKLADSLKSMVELERKVYGINDDIKGSGTLEDFLDEL